MPDARPLIHKRDLSKNFVGLTFCFVLIFQLLLLTSCENDELDNSTVPSDDYDNNGEIISPPIIVQPLLGCGESVVVKGFIPGAQIKIYRNGTLIGDEVGDIPDGKAFAVSPALLTGQIISATQEFDGVISGPSTAVEVMDHNVFYPSGLPQPGFPALDLYDCGIATVVNSLPPGGKVTVFSQQTLGSPSIPIGGMSGAGPGQVLGISPPFDEGNIIYAVSELCSDTSPPSEVQVVQAPPSELPRPQVTNIYDEGDVIAVNDLVNGSTVTIQRNGTYLGGGGTGSGHAAFRLNDKVSEGEILEITQELCGNISDIIRVTALPCDELPPAIIRAPRDGDEIIYLLDVVPGSRIRIYASGEEIGDGGGHAINLTRSLEQGETVVAVQSLGTCVGPNAHTAVVGQIIDDPLESGSCAYEEWEYGHKSDPDRVTTDVSPYFNSPYFSVTESMDAVPLHGVVRYPAGPGPFPLVLIVHGNHDPTEPSYPGYDYLLEHLASHCMIAVSIEEDFLNGYVGGEMDARAIVLLRHLQLWREWNQTPGHQFFTKIDMSNIGLAGHSRGGEAVVVAQYFNDVLHNTADAEHNFNFNIQSLYAIAPVDGQFDIDPISQTIADPITLTGADYYVMHGSHDGDVSDFAGHRMYDRAHPVNTSTTNFKGLLWVYGANHAQWNSVWSPSGDPYPIAPTAQLISAANQMTIGKSYITSFFLAGLKGLTEYRYFLNDEVSFSTLPAGVTRVSQYQDPDRIFINHYEEDGFLSTGSFPNVVNNESSLAIYNEHVFEAAYNPYYLWGETDGMIMGWNNSNGTYTMQIPDDLKEQIPGFEYMAFRVGQTFDPGNSWNAPGMDKDLSVQVNINGNWSQEISVSTYGRLPYPIQTDSPPWGGGTKTVMQTIRIPLNAFLGPEEDLIEFTNLEQIVLKFNKQNTGIIAIDEIQFTH